ncbi:MAG: glycosyltransferase family 9 protein [Magnetovibrionaceae bacterium]
MVASGPILVIKLSALGDFVQAFGPFEAIRKAHPDRDIHLLTTGAYAGLGEATGWFDRVVIDERPKTFDLKGWLALRSRLRTPGYARVYDLQTSGRSSRYFKLFWPGAAPEWSGIAKGCSHPHANPKRDFMHTIERQAEQLAMAGIETTPFPDLSALRSDLERLELPARFGLLVPGGAAHRRAKRWPWESYAELCRRLLAGPNITPVLIGQEAQLLEKIAAQAPGTLNLAGRTGLADIAELARRAEFAVGNDTGPMHVITLAGAHAVVLYSHDSDPALCAQRGPDVTIIRKPDLSDLPVDEVITAI